MVLLVGPMIAVIGILVAFYVLRGKAVQKRSLYASQRTILARKVQDARERTLAPVARAEKEAAKHEKDAAKRAEKEEKAPARGKPAPVAESPVDEAPAPAARGAWEVSPTMPMAGAPVAPASTEAGAPAWTPTAAPTPPPLPPEPPPPEPPPPAPAAEPPWHPSAPETVPDAPAAGMPTGWSVVGPGGGETPMPAEPAAAAKPEGKAGSGWEVVGAEPGEPAGAPGVRRPNAAVGAVQYAVLVVGLVMILIGCLVMIANVHTG